MAQHTQSLATRRGRIARQLFAAGFVAAGIIAGATSGVSPVSAATDGAVDASFNPGGAGANGNINALVFLSGGKALIAGKFTQYNGTTAGGIARLNADGTLDTAFNTGGAGFTRTSGTMEVLSIDVDASGKIYAAGSFNKYNGASVTSDSVVRLNADGTLDAAFVAPTFTNTNSASAEKARFVRTLGSTVFVSGQFDQVNTASPVTVSGLVVLDTTGAVDPAFGSNGRLYDASFGPSYLYSMEPVAGSTDYFINGSFRLYNGLAGANKAEYVARIKADGTRNTAYDNVTNVGPNNSINSAVQLSGGKNLLAGNFSSFNGNSSAKGIVRTNADGTLDATFSPAAAGMPGAKLAVDATGRIYIAGSVGAGYAGMTGKYVLRLNADGTLDTSFSTSDTPNSYDNKVAVGPDGNVVVYGTLTSYGSATVGRITRLTTAPAAAPTTTTTGTGSSGTGSTGASATGAPGVPTNVTATVSGTTATVKWSAPSTGGAPTSYLATADRTDSDAADLTCTAAAPTTTCKVSGLVKGKVYAFSVSASNASGASAAAKAPKTVTVPVVAVGTDSDSSLPTAGARNVFIMLLAAFVLLGGGALLRRPRRA